MGKKCSKCSGKKRRSRVAAVNGFDSIPYMEFAAAAVGAIVTGYADKMATTNEDGTAKEGFFTDNPTAKNAIYVAIGLGLTAFMEGEMAKGAGIGIAVYGAYNLAQNLMKPADTVTGMGVNGLVYMPPQNIAGYVNGLNRIPGDYGVAPDNIFGMEDSTGSNFVREQFESQMNAENMTAKDFIAV